MNNWSKRLSALLLAVLMAIMCVPAGLFALATPAEPSYLSADSYRQDGENVASDDAIYSKDKTDSADSEAADAFEPAYQPNDAVTILVKTGEPALSFKSGAEAAQELVSSNIKTQETVLANIESTLDIDIVDAEHFGLLFNGFSFEGEYWMVEKINAMEGLSAGVDYAFEVPEVQTDSQGQIVNANYAWDLGYTGEGQVIAIIDTGIRLSHEAFSVMPENPRITPEYLDFVYDNYANLMHGVSEDYYGSDFYHNEKVPIGISYLSCWTDPDTSSFLLHTSYEVTNDIEHIVIEGWEASDHGTHVAAIAAGNNGNDFRGIAPDAQLAIFRVGRGRSIHNEPVLRALEDCVYLGVDAINMSFGAPSVFTSDEQLAVDIYAEALELLENSGIGVAASAGNDGEYSSAGNYARNTGGAAYADYPENSMIGTPASYTYPISVASSDNALKLDASINVAGEQYGYIDICEDAEYAWITLEGEHAYVHAGLGRAEDFASLDVENKIALVQRGELSFEEKMQNAHAAGAIGIIVYNNTFGTIGMQIENYLIPAVSVTLEAGEAMLAAAAEGIGALTIEVGEFIDYSTANSISSFSSIGSTSDMRIKPEITAPGGNINSAIGFGEDNSYESWSGTSMAAPAVAGGYAVLMQALEERFPDMHKYELREIAANILLSTADPIENTLVRAQGAGLMDLAAATTADAYLTVPETYVINGRLYYNYDEALRPKLELMDSNEGSWNFRLQVNPLSGEAITYEISTEFYTLLPTAVGEYNGRTVYATDMTPMDITDGIVCTLPETFTSDPAAEYLGVISYENIFDGAITITEELAAELDEYFINGTFIEGYITLTPVGNAEGEEGTTLSIPVLAFYGDWDAAPVLDPNLWWMDHVGMDPLNAVCALRVVESDDSTVHEGMDEFGVNPYVEMVGQEFIYDRISYSPNGDTRFDLPASFMFGLLRNAAQFSLNVTNSSGELIWETGGPITKSSSGWRVNLATRSIDIDYVFYEADMAEGETWTVNMQVIADITGFVPENNEFCSISIPMTLDTTAPVVSVRDGQIVVYDAHYAAYVNVCSDENFLNSVYSSGIFEAERGAETLIDYEGEMAYVFVGDYAMNEKSYAVNMTTGEVTEITGGGVAVSDEMAAAALYDAESDIGFKMAMNAKWPFEMAEFDGRTVVKNSNSAPMTSGTHYTWSDSVLTTIAEMQAGQMLRFEYYVSSEEGFDWFRFYVNGEKYISASGDNRDWETFTFIAPEDGVYSFDWQYEKDQQVGYYDDAVYIDNIYIGDAIAAESLTASDTLEVTAGHRAEIEWAVAPYTANSPTFESSDESILTVDSMGVVTGVAEGEAEVTVTAGELTERVSVTVLPRGEYSRLYGRIKSATWGAGYNHDVWFDTDMLDVLNMPEAEEYKDAAMAYVDGYIYYTYTRFGFYMQGLQSFFHSLYKVPVEDFGNPEAVTEISRELGIRYNNPYWFMDYNYADGIMYAVRIDGALYTMGDLENLSTTVHGEGLIGNFTCNGANVTVRAFAFADDGAYAIGYTADDTETMLYRVDVATAECTVVGSTGIEEKLPYLQSMTYDYERGMMFFNYISDTSKFAGLNTIDLETGAATRIGGYGDDGSGAAQIVGLSCLTNGPAAREYAVTFVDGLTGDVIDEQSVVENESAVAPEAPVHEGYEFLGWRGDYTEVTEDTTVTAVYAEEIPDGVNINAYNLKTKSWVSFNSNNVNEFTTLSQWTSDVLVTSGEYVNGTVYGNASTVPGYDNFMFGVDTDSWEMQQLDEYYNEYLFTDAAYDYSTDTLYMLEASEDNNYAHLVGFKLTEDGGLEMVKDIELTCDGVVMSKLNTIAITTDGYAYSVEKMSGAFYSIDLETGECELVGSTGVNLVYYAQSMFFDHNTNRMFWAAGTLIGSGVAGSTLYEVNYLTGEVTLLGAFDTANVNQIISAFIVPETPLVGDVNGDGKVDAADAVLILRHALGVSLLPEEMLELADYDGDGEITSADALAALRIAMG